jgi:NAD(P)-dependent dehydrogenase (short-subunit alcohol dehydrogenase family)
MDAMQIDLQDRVVIISGGARGIGRTLVERFAAEGARVAALDHAFTDEVLGELAGRVLAVPCDVRDADAVQHAVDAVVAEYGSVDVLVNNAGINVEGAIADLTAEQWRAAFDVNVVGTFLLAQAVIPVMKAARRGRILNAASFAAIVPSIGAAAYGASKAAVVQLTRVMAGEVGPWDITVNAYAPGMIPTAMNGFAELPAEAQSRLLDTLTLRRWETADDVADLLIFLASDRAAYITGTLIDVSGGKLATQIPSRAYEGLS